ncbi:MAG: SGNH/GDSL hydrolase family protein [Calditrichia bacterium]
MLRRPATTMLLFFFLLLVELFSHLSLWILAQFFSIQYQPVDQLSSQHREILTQMLNSGESYVIPDSLLGWTIKPSGYNGLYHANEQGIRGTIEYQKEPPDEKKRISTFGDSFTHCDDVRDDETWQHFLQQSDSTLEVLNFGVGGYGLDQAHLRYLKKRKNFQSDIVFIGYMTDDIFRHENIFRPFVTAQTGLPLGKPRFVFQKDSLMHVANPFPNPASYERLLRNPQKILARAGEYDHYYQLSQKSGRLDFLAFVRLIKICVEKVESRLKPLHTRKGIYREESTSLALTNAILHQFYESVKEDGAKPHILFFPNLRDVKEFRKSGERSYQTMLDYCDRHQLSYIDLLDAFVNIESDDELESFFNNHYSAKGNRLVTRELAKWMKLKQK